MMGGVGKFRAIAAEEFEILNAVKDQIRARQSFVNVDTLVGLEVATQVVAGTNFIFKVKCDNHPEPYTIKVFRSLPHAGSKLELLSINEN